MDSTAPSRAGMSSVTQLSSLSLQHNSLSYNLEDSYASDWPTWWPQLTHLDLSDNYLSGTLPAGKGFRLLSVVACTKLPVWDAT